MRREHVAYGCREHSGRRVDDQAAAGVRDEVRHLPNECTTTRNLLHRGFYSRVHWVEEGVSRCRLRSRVDGVTAWLIEQNAEDYVRCLLHRSAELIRLRGHR
jgi:hypothetical protein